jgi:hypothetical protein
MELRRRWDEAAEAGERETQSDLCGGAIGVAELSGSTGALRTSAADAQWRVAPGELGVIVTFNPLHRAVCGLCYDESTRPRPLTRWLVLEQATRGGRVGRRCAKRPTGGFHRVQLHQGKVWTSRVFFTMGLETTL